MKYFNVKLLKEASKPFVSSIVPVEYEFIEPINPIHEIFLEKVISELDKEIIINNVVGSLICVKKLETGRAVYDRENTFFDGKTFKPSIILDISLFTTDLILMLPEALMHEFSHVKFYFEVDTNARLILSKAKKDNINKLSDEIAAFLRKNFSHGGIYLSSKKFIKDNQTIYSPFFYLLTIIDESLAYLNALTYSKRKSNLIKKGLKFVTTSDIQISEERLNRNLKETKETIIFIARLFRKYLEKETYKSVQRLFIENTAIFN